MYHFIRQPNTSIFFKTLPKLEHKAMVINQIDYQKIDPHNTSVITHLPLISFG